MPNKYAVRSVIFDKDMNTAILDVMDGTYYKIPGGGIEDGETEMEALHREMREEAGCEVEVLDKIAEFSFCNTDKNATYYSTCYVSRLVGDKGEPSFDEDEQSRNYKLVWMNAEEAIKLLEQTKPENEYENIIHNRDLGFLKKAKEYINNS